MEDRSSEIIAIAAFFLVLTWTFVGLRIYVRGWMLKSFGLDDWLMVVTQVCFTIYLGFQLGGVYHGTGKHAADLTNEQQVKALFNWYFCELFYIVTSTVLKVSLCVFLFRIAVSRLHVWILGIAMGGTAVFGAAYFFVVMFQCTPIPMWWEVSPGGIDGCISLDVLMGVTYCACALNAAVDWTIGIVPFFIVKDLNMPKNRKAMVAAILGFAAIGSTATIVRIPYLKALREVDDFLWATTDMAIWSTVEPAVGITAGCMATLRPLLRNALHRIGLSDSSHPADSYRLGNVRRTVGGYTSKNTKQQNISKKPLDPHTLRSLAYDDDTDHIIAINAVDTEERTSTMEHARIHALPTYGNTPLTPLPQVPRTKTWEGF